jgi:hypothetical protein
MPYTITVSSDNRYIILSIEGGISRETAMVYNLEAHKLGNALGINRYLVDVRFSRNTDSVIANYSFAYSDMNHEDIDRFAKVAILVSPDDHSHDFVETVSRNAGFDVVIFTDRDLAVSHLIE